MCVQELGKQVTALTQKVEALETHKQLQMAVHYPACAAGAIRHVQQGLSGMCSRGYQLQMLVPPSHALHTPARQHCGHRTLMY